MAAPGSRLAAVLAAAAAAAAAAEPGPVLEDIVVFGTVSRAGSNGASPTSVLLPEDLASINAATTEDLVKYEPGLVIRRRYIGDPNGTMGIRGSNMFQTTRSMVFADGLPLHYFLQTQYNGSPRWSLVAADEIGFIEVVYGPFSALYSGNAMGGVVNIETTIPTARRLHVEASTFVQSFEANGFEDAASGSRAFVSYGDKLGAVSFYAAYTRLDNRSQPQDFLFASAAEPAADAAAVSGSVAGHDEYGHAVRYFGNTGPQRARTDQLKTKVGYEAGEWLALGTVAYESRDSARDAVENYLRDALGAAVWEGSVADDGFGLALRGSDFAVETGRRTSLLAGVRVEGPLTPEWRLEAGVSYFEVLDDETRASLRNPRDPAHTQAGFVTAFEDTGWRTAAVALDNDRLGGNERVRATLGYRQERYGLELRHYESADQAAGERTRLANASGGTTGLDALFGEVRWQASDAWDVQAGMRHERWRSGGGFFDDHAQGVLAAYRERGERRLSPKLSIGFEPNDAWAFRYSIAKAYRFPIVEELYQHERRTSGTSIANAALRPENGTHRNLMLERRLDAGHVRVNVFDEAVADVIFNQTAIVDNRRITTFLPIDRVETRGIELVYNRLNLLGRLDLRLNATLLDARTVANAADRSIEGKDFPRMPAKRAHLLMTYRPGGRWDVGGGIRYASKSFGDLDNADVGERVYGAHDAYTQINLRASYTMSRGSRLHLGIDNLTDEIAYVHHPWPGRTLYLEASFDFEAGR